MKITVIGASGLIGTKIVALLREQGHEVVAASRSSGVDVLTGAGLADALAGADVVVDVSNSPNRAGGPAMEFFSTSTPHLLAAAGEAGVDHYVALSIVGSDALPDSKYMRAKVTQETLIRESGLPYSIVRATQFTEFSEAIVDSMTSGEEIRVPDALIQPIPSDQVAAAVAQAAVTQPINGYVNVGGPQKITFEQLARDVLARKGDSGKTVVVDPATRYFGTALTRSSLVMPD